MSLVVNVEVGNDQNGGNVWVGNVLLNVMACYCVILKSIFHNGHFMCNKGKMSRQPTF